MSGAGGNGHVTDEADLLCEQDGTTLTITFNRPRSANALTEDMDRRFQQALTDAEADGSIRAIVVTGAGRAFSSGFEMGPRPKPATTTELLRQKWDVFKRGPARQKHIMELDKPVIAAVNGWALGGGLWIAMCADIILASEQATFGQPEVRQNGNSTALFAFLAGWKNAHRYALTGDHFDAREALRMGLVNEVLPHDELLPAARAMAERIAKVPPDAVRVNKAITTQAMYAAGLADALQVNSYLSMLVSSAKDGPEMAHLTSLMERGDMRGFLKARDEPFLPEPGGPRSRPRPPEPAT